MKNERHVGGGTFRGGSGGSNTAGLGGRGGAYRVDSGHPVQQVKFRNFVEISINFYQMSDEEKKEVSAEVLAAAREMAKVFPMIYAEIKSDFVESAATATQRNRNE